MGFQINTNISSLNAQAQGTLTNNNLSSSLEKLSSGLKINKAADDASGMAIADKLRSQASSVGQGIANASSGNALITIADKAMGEQSKILDTVKTKLLQAATSTTSAEGREAIRKDIQKLLNQIDNISEQTTYNGINLLNEKGADFTFTVGEKSTDVIGMTTAYAVNTNGLGSSESDFGNSATIKGTASGQAISMVLEGENDDARVKVSNYTTGGLGVTFVAGSAGGSVMMDATSTTAITAASKLILEATNAEDKAFLDSQIAALTTDGFTKLADGIYSTSAATLTWFNSATHDFNDLKVTSYSAGGAMAFTSATEATIQKISGIGDITVTGAVEAELDGDSAEGIAFGGRFHLTEGTMAIEADAPVTNGAVVLNTVAALTQADSAELAVSIASEKAVTALHLFQSTGNASVILSTTDGATAKALEANGLSKNLEGKYVWTATTTASAELNFGSGLDLSNLTIEGLTKNTAGSEKIYVETTGAVTVENLGTDSGSEELQNGLVVELATSANMVNGASAGAGGLVATGFSASMVDSGLGASQLSGLLSIGENGLTNETAKNFLSVIDDAMTQLNSVRADFGSTQAQMQVAIDNMMTTQVNLKAAESVIRDVDYAAESANFNKQNIIAQAGTYAMSQANAVQQNVLRLLQ